MAHLAASLSEHATCECAIGKAAKDAPPEPTPAEKLLAAIQKIDAHQHRERYTLYAAVMGDGVEVTYAGRRECHFDLSDALIALADQLEAP